MGNSGLPQFKKAIFESIADKESTSMIGFSAVQAIRRIPEQFIDDEVSTMINVWYSMG